MCIDNQNFSSVEGHENVGRRPESRVGDGDSRRQKGREIGGGGELGAGRRLRR